MRVRLREDFPAIKFTGNNSREMLQFLHEHMTSFVQPPTYNPGDYIIIVAGFPLVLNQPDFNKKYEVV
jgi:hypothetical protein